MRLSLGVYIGRTTQRKKFHRSGNTAEVKFQFEAIFVTGIRYSQTSEWYDKDPLHFREFKFSRMQ